MAKKDSKRLIRDSLESASSPDAIRQAMSHRFEYHIFHAGAVHRIGRAAHEDVYDLIGEWVGKTVRAPGGHKLLECPVYVFLDSKLSLALTMKSIQRGMAMFEETHVMFGFVHEADLADELREIRWNPDGVVQCDSDEP